MIYIVGFLTKTGFEGRAPGLKECVSTTFLDLAASQTLIIEQFLERKLESLPNYEAFFK